ncbi:LolA family protein [Priestia taiwanensis]|uniref:Sporulation protein n=1 Tax=Priestia taiwanensis TaxID=1347902 RepID=A0A917AXY4_9BACI|nr:outer membrane lipoprotein carrier protein LolA [Priestia taiwanensis]MBM7365229.1 outer membrane lipoprotein-sorting protein [Priestia taiwanensis]GGE85563.1 sporulation protein [Priestia taiwanensis]
MKKRLAAVFLSLIVVLSLAACGERGKEDVVSSLQEKVEKMGGYKAEAKLTIKTGTEPQTYDVEIIHKKPMYYKVSLKNAAKGQSQIILRNDEGVFVLTPALNKSFKFQSDWPNNSSQAYLYESLVKDIVVDKEAKFTSSDSGYVFETKTNYHNNSQLPLQEIVLTKQELAPVGVKLMDNDKNPLVEVMFTKMQFTDEIDKGAFDVKKNMTTAKGEVPTISTNEADELEEMEFTQLPKGAGFKDTTEVNAKNGKRIIKTYDGEKSFTFMQEKSVQSEVSAPVQKSGEPVYLGYTVGALAPKMISWSYNGIDYTIASEDLTPEELVELASSMEKKVMK